MIQKTIIGLLILFIVSCKTDDVQSEVIVDDPEELKKDSVVNVIDRAYKTMDQIKLDNGIEIKWFVHGRGDKLEFGDVVSIDYKVYLMDSSIVDGNHLLQKESMPFMIGFNMQTEGWDIALQELKIGDFAEIYIPSKLARGENGIEGLIPANADNILKIRILDVVVPTKETAGNKVWLLEENTTNLETFNRDNEIEFHCMVSTPTNPLYVNTFRSNNTFKLRYGDRGTVPGLKKSLINAKKSDRLFVLVPASEGYGAQGYQDVVKPNEYLFYNILVMNVIE